MEEIKRIGSSLIIALPIISLYSIDIWNYSKEINSATCKGKVYYYKKRRKKKIAILSLYVMMLIAVIIVGLTNNI